MIPGLAGVLAAGVAIGIGTAINMPLAFASLASSTPEERMGQTMGAAELGRELGRELGDAGGPLLVAGVGPCCFSRSGAGWLIEDSVVGPEAARAVNRGDRCIGCDRSEHRVLLAQGLDVCEAVK